MGLVRTPANFILARPHSLQFEIRGKECRSLTHDQHYSARFLVWLMYGAHQTNLIMILAMLKVPTVSCKLKTELDVGEWHWLQWVGISSQPLNRYASI